MEFGNKLLELRKKENLSEEALAEKLNVTRQTISKWELNETSPDLKQALLISKLFNISLDELVNNDRSYIIEKISNTERLAGLVLKVLKWIGICFLVLLIIDIITFIFFVLI